MPPGHSPGGTSEKIPGSQQCPGLCVFGTVWGNFTPHKHRAQQGLGAAPPAVPRCQPLPQSLQHEEDPVPNPGGWGRPRSAGATSPARLAKHQLCVPPPRGCRGRKAPPAPHPGRLRTAPALVGHGDAQGDIEKREAYKRGRWAEAGGQRRGPGSFPPRGEELSPRHQGSPVSLCPGSCPCPRPPPGREMSPKPRCAAPALPRPGCSMDGSRTAPRGSSTRASLPQEQATAPGLGTVPNPSLLSAIESFKYAH